ncbi:hypothetical protein EKK58_04530 [Candidatus Dependentiae bacterium]|nr:MAG: hypothetical protein EKK58_04530 [Candidatus Dependentiae bacterium]
MNKIFRIHALLVIIGIIFLLPGCSTIINWSKKNLYQGIDLHQNYHVPQSFIRSIKVYDEFATLLNVHALWLSEEVRNAYVSVFVDATGKKEEQKNQLLRLQKDELKHFITFYVVAPQDTILNIEQSPWHIFLSIDTLTFDPIEIKIVELNKIYKSFFGKLYNRFKTVYQVKFEAQDLYGNPLIIPTTQAIELHFKNLNKEVLLRWDLINTTASIPTQNSTQKVTDTFSPNEYSRLHKKNKKEHAA